MLYECAIYCKNTFLGGIKYLCEHGSRLMSVWHGIQRTGRNKIIQILWPKYYPRINWSFLGEFTVIGLSDPALLPIIKWDCPYVKLFQSGVPCLLSEPTGIQMRNLSNLLLLHVSLIDNILEKTCIIHQKHVRNIKRNTSLFLSKTPSFPDFPI